MADFVTSAGGDASSAPAAGPEPGPDRKPDSLQIGVSRPPLTLDDLPTPEEVFDKPRIGFREIVTVVLGPSMIALGASLGSGEWLLGPLAFGKYGFLGLGWLIVISGILQVLYNVENARYVIATGEVPIVGFSRVPPGFKLWIPATLFIIILGWIWGGWAAAAGQSLFALFSGRAADASRPGEVEAYRLIAVGLMFLSLLIYSVGRKIERTLALVDTFMVILTLGAVVILAVVFAPGALWVEMLRGIVTPAAPPSGIDPVLLGSIIGYTGFGSGMNFLLINYYRDHGYGMGHKVGFFSGLVGGEKKSVRPSGMTFRESPENAALWKRWFRYLKIDQWGVFFTGAMIGMFVPGVLVRALAAALGAAEPTTENIPVYAAVELGRRGGFFFVFVLIIGAMILFKTQTSVLEILIRNVTDSAIAVSPRLRERINGDPRRAYYGMAVLFILVIAVIIHLALPARLLQIAGNMSTLASLIYPVLLIYLNTKLPRPARAGGWSIAVLVLNILFFGYFFLNFAWSMIAGRP
ncbi:MAG TPA: Nramp family divalent metal transporter [Candidatus Aminicenantes bacterium]|nr:Nramp family divalent metal transporter [Candidatus Aminicenantes bacterium]